MASRDSTGVPTRTSANSVRETRLRNWNQKWADGRYHPKWFDRGVSPEIVEAVDSGWLPGRGQVLDVGCGMGDVAAWFAERGYQATGADFAEAVRRASERHAAYLNRGLRFVALDISGVVPRNERFDIIVDRGCLHGIPEILVECYVANISLLASPGARMLLFMKAFRDGEPFGDEAHTRRKAECVRDIFRGQFTIESHRPIYMRKNGLLNPRHPLPGLLFRLTRTQPAKSNRGQPPSIASRTEALLAEDGHTRRLTTRP